MSQTRKWLIGGAAALALAGTAAVAEAQAVHEFTVQLPGGGVEHIRYTGDAKPVVVMLPPAAIADPFAASFFGPSPFAELQQISARMDQQMNAMFAQARAMQAAAQSGQFNAALGSLPGGGVEYTQVSTWTGNSVCTHTIRMIQPDNGGKLQVVSNVSGACGSQATPGRQTAPAANPSGLIEAKAVAAPHHARAAKT